MINLDVRLIACMHSDWLAKFTASYCTCYTGAYVAYAIAPFRYRELAAASLAAQDAVWPTTLMACNKTRFGHI